MPGSIIPNLTVESNFLFVMDKTPTLTKLVQEVQIPGFRATPPKQGNQFIPLPRTPDTLEKDELVVSYLLDEDWTAYLEIKDWLFGLGFPEKYEEFRNLHKQGTRIQPSNIKSGLDSEAKLQILTNAKNAKLEFTFTGVFPTALPQIRMTSKSTTEQTPVLEVSFEFVSMLVRIIK